MASAFSKLTVQIGGNIKGLQKSLRRSQKLVSTFSQNTRRTINEAATAGAKGFKNMVRSDAFQTAAVAATGMGTAMFGAVRTAMEFESAMLKVKAISGATNDQFKQLTDQAKLLGRTTQFSASEAADAMSFLSMAGYDTNQILSSTGHMLNLAAAAGMELGSAADIASNILGGMGLKISDTNLVIDVLAKTASSGNTNIEMLGESFKNIAAIAPKAGVSIQDAGAAFAVLGNSGIQASEAGTALRNILLRLSAPPSEAAKAFAKLGVSTKDAAGNMRPYADILRDMDRRMKQLNLGTAEQTELQAAIFGVRAAASGATLQEAAANGELAKMLDKVTDSQGAASEMAKTMQSGLGGSLKRLQSAAEGLAIAFGGPLLSPIASALEGLSGLLSPIAGLLEKMPVLAGAIALVAGAFVGLVALSPFIASFISIASVLGPAIAGMQIGATIAGWAGAIGPALAAMGAIITGPIGITIGIIAGLGLAIKALWDLCPPFRAAVTAAFEGIKAAGMFLWEGIKAVFDGIIQIFEGWIEYLKGAFNIVVGIFTGDSQRAVDGVAQVFNGLGMIFEPIIGAVKAIWSGFANSLKFMFIDVPVAIGEALWQLPGKVMEVFGAIGQFIQDFPAKFIEVGGKLIDTIIQGVKDRAGALVDTVKATLAQVRDLLPFSDAKKGPLAQLTENGANVLTTMADGMHEKQGVLAQQFSLAAEGGTTTVQGMVQKLAEQFKSVPGLMGDVGELIIDTVVEGLKRKAEDLYNTVKGIFGKVRQLLPFSDAKEGPFSQLTANGAAIIRTLIDGIRQAAPQLSSVLSGVLPSLAPTAATAATPTGGGSFLGNLLDVVAPIASTFNPMVGGVMAMATPVLDAILPPAPQPAAAGAGAGMAPTINAPVTINVAGTDASAEDIASQVEMAFSNILSDAEAGVRAFLND